MRDIYELLNDFPREAVMEADMERVELSDYEKRRIYGQLTGGQSTYGKKAAPAGQRAQGKKRIWRYKRSGMSRVAAGAAVIRYINGNAHNEYRKPVGETLTATASTETGETQSIDKVNIQVEEVSRSEDMVYFDLKLVFDEDVDLTNMKADCEEWCPYEGYRDIMGEPLLSESTIYFDGVDTYSEDWDEENNRFVSWQVAGSGEKQSFEGNAMKIQLSTWLWTDEAMTGDHTIQLQLKNLNLGDQVLAGEWNYEYQLSADAYSDVELATAPCALSATDANGMNCTVDSYAVTVNGLILYGTMQGENNGAVITRILATDDLGNNYLMYPAGCDKNDVTKVRYSLYKIGDGECSKGSYQTKWDEDAKEITIQFESELSQFDESGKEYLGSTYEVISDSQTITLE